MKQKALVAAVCIAVGAPVASANAAEPDSVVQLYGKAYPEIVIPHGSGATEAGATTCAICAKPTGENEITRRTEMESSNSRLGVRGHERLGKDLKAIFQLETEFHLDSNDSAFARRDSFVGLDHKRWGTIKLGRMDTPFKKYGDEISVFGISSGNFVSSSNVFRKTGFGTNSASSFHLRRPNAVQYEMPRIAGFDAAVQYSTDETDTSTRHPHVWSAGVSYSIGPLQLEVAHERHWDLFGGSRNAPSSMSNFTDQNVRSRDKATSAAVVYKVGVHRFEADWNRKEYEENPTVTGRFESYKNNAYMVKWAARWSRRWATHVDYIHASAGSCGRHNASCDTSGLEGKQIDFGVAYYFSRRTFLFLIGSILENGHSARFNNEELQDPAVGEDITQYALGINHSF